MEKHTNRNSYDNSEDTPTQRSEAKEMAEIAKAIDTGVKAGLEGADLSGNEDITVVTDAKPELPKSNEKQVKVSCYQLYLRPEPNKKFYLAILTRGTVLTVIEEDEKLPEGWLHVSTGSTEGYVIAEYVESV